MKLYTFTISVSILLLSLSCSNGKNESDAHPVPVEESKQQDSLAINPTQPEPELQPVQAPQSLPATAGTTAFGNNPPHGQPGHRCDIPVGAPLNSAPANQTINVNPAPSVQTTPMPESTTNTPSTTSGKINPPHGEPGHRCDIPVGKPLP